MLISTVDQCGEPNLAPMSSAWWLGDRCVLGLAASAVERDGIRIGLHSRHVRPRAPEPSALGRPARSTLRATHPTTGAAWQPGV